MRDVEPGAGPLGEDDRAPDRLHRADLGARGEVGEGVGATGSLEPGLPARHDRRVLGVHGAPVAAAREDLEALEHRAVGGRRQVAEGVAHEAFEARDTGVHQGLELPDVVLVEQPVDPIVDVGLRLGDRLLLAQRFNGPGGRPGVRHFEDGGHAAAGGAPGPGLPVLLVVVAGRAEVDVGVDRTGEDVLAGRVDRLASGWERVARADRDDRLGGDRDGCLEGTVGSDDLSARDHDVDAGHRLAHPPSTGRSTPVICRDRSLTRNTTAFATSSPVEMRRSA